MNILPNKNLLKGVALGLFLTAGIANAASMNTVSAKLVTPLAAPLVNLVAADVAWNCNGDTCITVMERRTAMARDCRQLARKVGAVAAFKVGDNELNAEGLAVCNAGIN